MTPSMPVFKPAPLRKAGRILYLKKRLCPTKKIIILKINFAFKNSLLLQQVTKLCQLLHGKL